jgi:Fic family protein
MSHAMAQVAGIGAHGLWSVSRGLARGLQSPSEYKLRMDHADMPRQGDLDGRGNLSLRALSAFSEWFLQVCLDQITFMESLFELDTLSKRLRSFVTSDLEMKKEAADLVEAVFSRGEIPRGDAARITVLSERTARRILSELEKAGLLGSETPKSAVHLRFPAASHDALFPRLFPAAET